MKLSTILPTLGIFAASFGCKEKKQTTIEEMYFSCKSEGIAYAITKNGNRRDTMSVDFHQNKSPESYNAKFQTTEDNIGKLITPNGTYATENLFSWQRYGSHKPIPVIIRQFQKNDIKAIGCNPFASDRQMYPDKDQPQ